MYTALLNVTFPGKFKTDNVVGGGDKGVMRYLVVSIYLSMFLIDRYGAALQLSFIRCSIAILIPMLPILVIASTQ